MDVITAGVILYLITIVSGLFYWYFNRTTTKEDSSDTDKRLTALESSISKINLSRMSR